MKDAINYFIPILKEPMNDITGRCMTSNALDSAYCGSYQLSTTVTAKAMNPAVNMPYPNVHMETNSMEIQYNNLVVIDDYQEQYQDQLQQHQEQQRLRNRKRNNCDLDSIAIAKRCRREDSDPLLLSPEFTAQAASPLLKNQPQMHQRQPTHNMPDMPRCLMGHYV